MRSGLLVLVAVTLDRILLVIDSCLEAQHPLVVWRCFDTVDHVVLVISLQSVTFCVLCSVARPVPCRKRKIDVEYSYLSWKQRVNFGMSVFVVDVVAAS